MIVAAYLVAQLAVATLDPNLNKWSVTAVEATVIAVIASFALWFAVLRPLRSEGRAERFDSKLSAALQIA